MQITANLCEFLSLGFCLSDFRSPRPAALSPRLAETALFLRLAETAVSSITETNFNYSRWD
ncbi:hypothetical protein RchiOBHm_Chr1g0343421 [Rosa chinensis]|uniref:Uncharacterized protein n=1 Tax=Rosa chinensis TaxID=74649 RepID=A0A2P6SE97_ROSCH|nr:hypothetical protein RchiOBHm_Chr1g0343421 [Rosa chinensis]